MSATPAPAVTVVVPTIGRDALARLLTSLDTAAGHAAHALPAEVVVVDDRPPNGAAPLPLPTLATPLADRIRVVRTGGRGPAAARNLGWRAARTPWIAFLDDDVEVTPGWLAQLRADLAAAPPQAAAVQGRVLVPRTADGRISDTARATAQLHEARWITADLAVRRAALQQVDGFDERFPRAYREDTDLALRLEALGLELADGERVTLHPLHEDRAGAVRRQRGNADDARMLVHHGPGWRRAAGTPRGRRRRHQLITLAGLTALAAATPHGNRTAGAVRRIAAAAWAAGTLELAAHRIRRSSRRPGEVVELLATSLVIPPAATAHHLAGLLTALRQVRRRPGRPHPRGRARAVLLDRDGTLVHDVPHNGDPDRVAPVATAAAALARLRAEGIATAVVTNQRAVGEGWITAAQLDAVNARVDELLGGLGPVHACPHVPAEACGCRKPAPGLVTAAAADLGVDPRDCVVIGDTGADVAAALAAGARAVLVPNDVTRVEEIAAAPVVAADLAAAVELVVEGRA